MRNIKFVFAATGILVLVLFRPLFGTEITWQDISRGNTDLKAVLVDPDEPRFIYLGSKSGVLKSEDSGKSYRCVLSVRQEKREVNFLIFGPRNKKTIYAATGSGLYRSNDSGRNWKRLFKGRSSSESQCTAVAPLSSGIYLGTGAGLFVSRDNGRTWQKSSGDLKESPILAIATSPQEPDTLYVACVNGVYRSQNAGSSWERAFVTLPTEADNDTEEESDDSDEQQNASRINYLSVDPKNQNFLYLATDRGVYLSRDKAKTWSALPSFGLLSPEVKFLLVASDSRIYAGTRTSVFEYRKERWHELSFGLVAKEIRFLAQDKQANIYAACDNGLFKAGALGPQVDKQVNPLESYYQNEPAIDEVQQAAIKYAEVEPEKIALWRKQASKRALLPKLSISFDQDKDKTSSSSIWGTYGTSSTPGKYYTGPDDETNYDNHNWGVCLSWELGDLIWNDDQTSIDVRSRLMVQLREDILDEVTKLYFERLRLKLDLDNLAIEDRRKRMEKELKIKELSASLDALTGGYFSRQLQENSGVRLDES